MIKLTPAPVPTFLTSQVIQNLTSEYLISKTSVWNRDEIKTPLLASSNGKCAYCECDLTEESKYMEVEHFENKNTNPQKVVVWSNLLPSCKRCNIAKGAHDVRVEPIVNPYFINPKDHLIFRLYRIEGKTVIGKKTEEVLDLNNYERATKVRFAIGEGIMSSIQECHDRLERFRETKATRTRNRLLSLVESLLEECLPSNSYAATASTILSTDRSFLELLNELKSEGLWRTEFETKWRMLLSCALKTA